MISGKRCFHLGKTSRQQVLEAFLKFHCIHKNVFQPLKWLKVIVQPTLSHQHFPAHEGKHQEEVLQAPEEWLVAWMVKTKTSRPFVFCPLLIQGDSLLSQDDPALSCKAAAIFVWASALFWCWPGEASVNYEAYFQAKLEL